jgi:hypothetical protein
MGLSHRLAAAIQAALAQRSVLASAR